ncbi:putative F-box/LRR-repeat protein At5g02700 [Lycium ferocissimum]|uniref:putative F-box/LRR-repeat protein At5g02700 n=1 Tax=Lycium ferocissimum TaxID=112874 RepID=UPI0028149765|nr:putative F-box/LRR-repeat protein At5g02700 [Lycium ferocissimum]
MLPKSLCICSSLITLVLNHCRLEKGFVIEWKSLNSLKLKYAKLDDDDIVNLLSGCPDLETLESSNVEGFSRLEIISSNLKRLKFEEYWFSDDEAYHSLGIIAPYIRYLEISGNLYDLKCKLVNVSSVVSAKLTFQNCYTNFTRSISGKTYPDTHQVIRTLVQDYLQKLSYATQLTIGTWLIEVLLQLEGLLLPELKCKCLTLDLHITRFSSKGVAILLQASPYVETLNITMATMTVTSCNFSSSYCTFIL